MLRWCLVLALALAFPALADAQSAYVGDEVCAGCHEASLEPYSHTIHAKVLNEKNARTAAMARGCEACHGAGGAHVEAGGGAGKGGDGWIPFGGSTPAEIDAENAACLGCHEGGTQRLWVGSPHEARGVACGSCHVVMRSVSDDALLTHSTQTALCTQCHPLPRAQQLRSAHMPTRQGVSGAGGEGWMDCGSCHNPHGSIADALITQHTINDNCYSCHADKRGPFLWEHSPVSESCLNCHVPHGSLKPAMLKIASPRLCQTCHIETLHPSEARLQDSRFVVGRSCQHCHQKVHGSNHPSGSGLTR